MGALFLAVMLANPNTAFAGIISVLAAYGFAWLIGMGRAFLASGHYIFNPLLVGLSLGYVFKLTPETILFVVLAGILGLVVTVAMLNVFQTYLKLPALSLPSVVVSSIAYLAALRYSSLLAIAPEAHGILASDLSLPMWLAGYFKSFGAILFAPNVVVGLMFALLVLYSSRILFMLSVLGYYVGTLVRALFLGASHQAFGDVYACNFTLTAMAIGGIFLVPSPRSYLLAGLATMATALLLDATEAFWSLGGIPAFALPFNLVCLCMIYVAGLMGYPLMAKCPGKIPEETLDNYLANGLRYRGEQRSLSLPFAGRWTVWQGVNGHWTHKGNWRHAYDFVIADELGNTHNGDGSRLEDYYAYRRPVLSPVRGQVARVVDSCRDSSIGSVDTTDNWGNLVILYDQRGFYVEISHFASKSISVKEGDWVERGAALGLCGNSGYSPQPHIHVQVQADASVGAATLPFSFVSFSNDGHYYANEALYEQQQVEPLCLDKRLDTVTSFVLDDVYEYDVLRDDRVVDHLALTVKMAPDGTFYFQSDRGQLYFGKHDGTFYFYRVEGSDPWLRQIFLAVPRLPLAHRGKLTWCDYVPVGVAVTGLRRVFARFMSSFWPGLVKVKVSQEFVGRDRVHSVIESKALRVCKTAEATLANDTGFASITIGNIELRRVKR